MELRKAIIILVILKRKLHLFSPLKIAGGYVSFMLMGQVDGDTQAGLGRRNVPLRLWEESRPKLLSFKENDSGTTKLETRVRTRVFGSGYYTAGQCVELKEDCLQFVCFQSRILGIHFITKSADFALTQGCYKLSKNYFFLHIVTKPVGISDGRPSQLESNSNIFTKTTS